MLFHVSIEAENPENVAKVIAELWGRAALPFPGVVEESWIALAGDEKCSAIEVYPRGTELREGPDVAYGTMLEKRGGTASHIVIASVLTVADILAIFMREGWKAKLSRPGDAFSFVECWVEGTIA